MRRVYTAILPAVAVALVAFAWLSHLNPPVFPINDDSIRDQLLVRDCADLGRCHLLGASSSFGGLYHGAVWIELLTVVRLLGGAIEAQRTMVLVILALSVALLFVFVWQWLGAPIALPAAVLLLGALSFEEMPATVLTNPSIAVFSDIVTAAGLFSYGLTRRRRFLIVSAFALGIGISVHLASLSLVVPLLLVASVARPWSWRAVLTAVAIVVVTYAIPSSATFRANAMALAERGRLLPVLASALLVVVVAARLGSHFRRLSWNTRAWVIGLVLVVPFALTSLWLVVGEQHHFSVIYVHPVLAPAAALTAALIVLPFERAARVARPLRWIPTAAAAAVVLCIASDVWTPAMVEPMQGPTPWDLVEAAAVADGAMRRGWAYDDLLLHLQGTGCRELLVGMSLVAPVPQRAPSRSHRQLQVVRAPAYQLMSLGARDDLVVLGSHAAALREIESWLRPAFLKACRVPIGSSTAPRCGGVIQRTPDAPAAERFLFISRTFPVIDSLDVARPYIATYEIPLAPRAGETRDLTISDEDASACGWRITRVEGLRVEGTLPARRLRLHATDSGSGLVVFEKPFGTSACPAGDLDMRYPPCVLETEPGDPLQALMDSQ